MPSKLVSATCCLFGLSLAACQGPATMPIARPVQTAAQPATQAAPDASPEPFLLVAATPDNRPRVDVVFVLDTTGSMTSLIDGAKRRIWAIANQVLEGRPTPHVRFGLVGYRDLGDEYVTKQFPLTENIEEIYLALQGLEANGGGDTPEHVNRGLAIAIREMQWRRGKMLRQIFLVGDAPPHEGRDELTSTALAEEAKRDGIIINTVRCGQSIPATGPAWYQIAQAAGGLYTTIGQDGDMHDTATPQDQQLAELNGKLSDTLLPTGSASVREEAEKRLATNRAMSRLAQAESAKYRARSGQLDGVDLLTVLARGQKLESIPDDELPPAVAALPRAQRAAYVAQVKRQRDALMQQIKELTEKRKEYLASRAAAPAHPYSADSAAGSPAARPAPPRPSFHDSVGKALRKQGAAFDLVY